MQCVVDLPVNQELLKPAARWLIYKTMFANYLPLDARDKKINRGLWSLESESLPSAYTSRQASEGHQCRDFPIPGTGPFSGLGSVQV